MSDWDAPDEVEAIRAALSFARANYATWESFKVDDVSALLAALDAERARCDRLTAAHTALSQAARELIKQVEGEWGECGGCQDCSCCDARAALAGPQDHGGTDR